MNKDTATYAHPGFVESIKNLAPDEARILRSIVSSGKSEFPLIDLVASEKFSKNIYEIRIRNFSHIGEQADVEHRDLVLSYIDNLCRLRLLFIREEASLVGDHMYDELEKDIEVQKVLDQINQEDRIRSFLIKQALS